MSQYTTGEAAKLCGVTVRTVQYYDSRNILTPSALSEGGRRLYSEDDLRRLKVICFLRDIGLPISAIGQLLSEEDPGSVIDLLLEQQEGLLRQEVEERQQKLSKLEQLKREIKTVERFSVEAIGDIAQKMETRKKLHRTRLVMLTLGLTAEILELGALLLWIFKGIWWPYVVSLGITVLVSVWLVRFYYRRVSYICPQCHAVFKPGLWEFLWARHTMSTRRLTCGSCGHYGFCVETADR